MRSLLVASCVAAAAVLARAEVDMEQCSRETMLIYNSSAVAILANRFFDSLNISLYSQALAPQPGHKRLRSELARGLVTEPRLYATLEGTGINSPYRKAFYAACEQISGGWCPQVNVTATWTTQSGAAVDMQSVFGMCFPYSCCDGSGCDMSGGLSAVAATGVTSVITRWCGGGSLCPNRTDVEAPLRGSAVSGGSLGALLRSGSLSPAGKSALAILSGRGPGDDPLLDESSSEPNDRAAALHGGSTDLRVVVVNYCLASVFDTLMYVALGGAVVLCFCGCLVVGQRACTLRRAVALDLAAQYDGFEEDEEAVREREARAARRKQHAASLAFAFGSRPLRPAASASASSQGRPEPQRARGSQASESLLAAAEAEGTAADTPARDTPAEEPTDPISLETIAEGDSVVQFPVCAHLFHTATLQQWLITHDTCPVCRQAFPDSPAPAPGPVEGRGPATVASADAKPPAPVV